MAIYMNLEIFCFEIQLYIYYISLGCDKSCGGNAYGRHGVAKGTMAFNSNT